MRVIISLVICAAVVMHWTAVAGQGFLPGTEDIPAMPGLQPSAGGEIVFDTPSGRIITVVATAPVPASRVSEFYADSLPALGWRPAGPNLFVREGELLQLSIQAAGGQHVEVQFTLSPVRAPGNR